MRNTSRIGEVSVAQVISALVNVGNYIYMPFGDSKRSDFLTENEEGRFFRVQCKTGRLTRGTVSFTTCSIDSRSVKGRCIRKGYRGQIDYFGVYCPDNRKCYLVPIEHAPNYQCFLRVEPPSNNQLKNVRWAKDYEIGDSTELGKVPICTSTGKRV
jgi:hypothetical protein